MSEYTPDYWIKCLRGPGGVQQQYHVAIADCFAGELALLKGQTSQLDSMIYRLKGELKHAQELLNRREETFQKEHKENRLLKLSGDKNPLLDMQTMLPGFLKAITQNAKGMNLEQVLADISKVKDPKDAHHILDGFLKPLLKGVAELTIEEGEEGEEVAPDRITRKGFLYCPHDGLKCTHECEGDECWRELDGS